MLLSTKAIVLSKLKYNDNDLIIKCYTYEKGIVSFLKKGILKSKKKTSQIAYFQPLSQLQLIIDCKPNRSLQYIKEVKLDHTYNSLHSNVLKSAIVLFLSEILANVIQEEETNNTLYDYIENSLLWLDLNTFSSNFHLLFLLNLSKYLGFYPNTENSKSSSFNLRIGKFETFTNSKNSISGENLILLKQLLGTTFDRLNEIKLNSKQRHSFLTVILLYFEFHFENFKPPKSLQVFNDVFN